MPGPLARSYLFADPTQLALRQGLSVTAATTLRTHRCGSLSRAQAGETVRLGGWIHRRRDLGGLLFVDLRDRDGLVQLSFDPKWTPADVMSRAASLGPEYVVLVTGVVSLRPMPATDQTWVSREVEVQVQELQIVGPAVTPAVPVSRREGEELPAEELRLKYRVLDLRRPELQARIVLRHRLLQRARQTLSELGFLEIETPILTKPTPEGARDYLVPSRVHAGEFYALPQSPQIYKQLLMLAGFDRYFQIARCFRDEDLRADRQPEFTQVDIELSFPRIQTIFSLIEPLFARLLALRGTPVTLPFPRLSWDAALERYGSDKPDLRFDLPITDVTDEIRELGLDTFPSLIAEGARCRALVLPAAGAVSGTRLRKINEEIWLGRIVGDARAARRNLFTLKASDEATANLVKKGASEAVARRLFDKLGAGKEDTVLMGTDQPGPLAMAMGILRLEMGRELKLIDESAMSFLWVTDFPLFEYDHAERRYQSVNHPFTAPRDEDIALLDSDPGAVRAQAYDIVLNGTEVGGGSLRIHDSALQAKVFKLLSLTDEETRERFGFFIEALQYGTPPHGGIALGLDRIVMILAGEASLRDVIAFPKTASATDLMSGSPSPVRDEQVRDLGIVVVRK